LWFAVGEWYDFFAETRATICVGEENYFGELHDEPNQIELHFERNNMSDKPKKPAHELRSQQWFGRQDRDGFAYRSWVKGKGVPHDQFDGRPVIGICNTFSELTPCNSHFRTLAEQVKIGVYEAGGFPLEFPVMSLGETLLRPTAMLYRNLASMDVEESIRGNPIDGVVLLMGCDKTTPALLMGAASADLPTIGVSGGPMLNGKWRGQELGSGTGLWQMSEQVRSGTLKLADFFEAESCMHRSHGHCMTMGTASTMAAMVEALGVGLPGNAAYPAVDGRRNVIARMAGRRVVDMVHEDQKLSSILTREAFENAIKTLAAIGGSTNAVIHLIAIAGRLGVPLTIDDFDRLASQLPCLLNLQPSGQFLMEDFCYAGGLPAVMKAIALELHLGAITANGQTIGDNIADAQNYNPAVIKTMAEPFKAKAGIAVLRGNLAPRGAVIKPSAATPALMQHTGRAVVFEDSDDFHRRIDDDNLDVDETCVLVLKNCGPKGYPGMAEVGNMPLPPKVLKKGITDMVRISDARMSGTAYGTVVLHTAPEAAAGGTLALVRNGDLITLDVAGRRLHLHVDDAELAHRLTTWQPPVPRLDSGYWKLYIDHVTQADEGADLDFLRGKRGAFVPKDNH
jgi:L-arabonate dehydrase